ncbi:MAG: WecB/TagA/CpsF family glycosyltransferase [Rhodocyclaceae bacterium]|nr:WecB/TagA/CpsF family glycosyltransferase [Rhodocyclaceae bacterium]
MMDEKAENAECRISNDELGAGAPHSSCDVHDSSLRLPSPVRIGGFPVRPLTRGQLISVLVQRACQGPRTSVHYLNTYTFALARRDAALGRVLAGSDLLYADGMSVVWAGRLLGRAITERLSAADYFEGFCRRCARRGVALFLLGGQKGAAAAAAAHLCRRVPGLAIAGTHHGYFHDAASHEVVRRINASGARVLLAGMGSPRQELWLDRHAAELAPPVRWSVGALFDYFAGRERRAPAWMCRCGGEWFYRLLHRPRERWRRYLLANAAFAAAVLGELWAGDWLKAES